MKWQSNNLIVLLSIIVIISIVFSLWVHYIGNFQLTGLVVGTVNVTVNESIGISLSRAAVNFTVTNPGVSRSSYNATDLVGAPITSCDWAISNATCGINLTNDGSVNVNITMQDTGSNIFKSASFLRHVHFLFNVSVPISSFTNCRQFYNTTWSTVPGVSAGVNWIPVNTSAITVVCSLNFSNTGYGGEVQPDVAAIEFNLSVPGDEPSGTKGTTLEITSVRAGL